MKLDEERPAIEKARAEAAKKAAEAKAAGKQTDASRKLDGERLFDWRLAAEVLAEAKAAIAAAAKSIEESEA